MPINKSELIIANLRRVRDELAVIEKMIDDLLPDDKKMLTHSIIDRPKHL